MILLKDWLLLSSSEQFTDAFIVIVQLPAILSVVLYFWQDLWPFHRNNKTHEVIRLWVLTGIAFLPAAFFGFLFDDFIEERLFNALTVVIALAVGGVILILLERRKTTPRFESVHDLHWKNALAIGFFQCLAMIPGTSRSAATIIGAMLLGASRGAAAEFSFFLAIPTMLGATTLKILKNGAGFTGHEWLLLLLGATVSFATAYAVIAFLMHFIRKHSFEVFGYYRIALAVIVFLLIWA